MRNYLRQSTAQMRRLEDVFEDAANINPGALVGIETQRAITEIQRANIIEAKNVVSMAVSDQYCVQPLQAVAQGLLAKVGGCVDEDRLSGVFDDNRDAQTFVARILRQASLAFAANGRNAGGSSGPEKSKLHDRVQCPMSNVQSQITRFDFGLSTLNFGLLLSASDVAAGVGAGLRRGGAQRHVLHAQVSEQA